MSDATAVQAVLATCQQRGIMLHVAGEKVTVDAPEGTLTPDLLAALRQYKAGLVELLKNGRLLTETTGSANPNPPDTDVAPWDKCLEPPDPCPKCGSLMIWWDVLGGRTLHDLRQTEASARESSGTTGTGRTVTPVRGTGEFFSTRPLTFSAIDRN